MKQYSVYMTTEDYRGSRVKIDNVAMNWAEIQALLGETLLSFESSKMLADGTGYRFSGRYQAAHGGMESHGAEILWDIIQEVST